MRSLRWLLLAAMVLVAAAVLGTYRSQRRALASHSRPLPPKIALDTKTSALDWEWGQSAAGLPQVHITAKDMRQSADGKRAELKDIELRLYSKDGETFTRVRTTEADFLTADNKLISPGAAEITLDVPVNGEPSHPLTSITAAGINFDSQAGAAVTDGPVSFTFEQGTGTCTGADYDPAKHVLNLNHNVVLNLKGKTPGAKPMKVETEHLVWNEETQVLLLLPWSRLTRDTAVIEGGDSTVQLKDQVLSWIDAPNGHGTDNQPGRKLDYSANLIHVDFDEIGEMQKLAASGKARLVSTSVIAETTVTASRVDLTFIPDATVPGAERPSNVLSVATAVGNGELQSKPLVVSGTETADSRIVKADSFTLRMKPGGKEIDRMNTNAPGTLELIPNQRGRHRRLVKADRITMTYGARNEIREFHGSGSVSNPASTESQPSQEELARKNANVAVAYTSSRDIDAAFDDSGQMKTLSHRAGFKYRQGTRQAQADNAILDNERNRMNLENHARVWDDTGATAADRIQIDQESGDFDARGHVFTTRLPDSKPPDSKPAGDKLAEKNKPDSGVLDNAQPVQGTAERVTSSDRNRQMHYMGNAVLWQPANRIQGDRIDIDREKKTVVAEGKVVTQFQDQPKDEQASAQPVFTLVRAQKMTYSDADLLANYSGGVDFRRPALTVSSATLKAFLNPKETGKDSRINRALSDGKVEIVETIPGRKRIGTGEHGEYYTDEGKVMLSGGSPQLNDTVRGNTKGDLLTYFTNDDRLLVNGVPERQVQSHVKKKKP